MTTEQFIRYRNILIEPINECAKYTPKFGHGRNGGFSFPEFQRLYGADAFYKWLGLDNPLMYSAHKAAGGITSIYRQIGIGCERLVRAIFRIILAITRMMLHGPIMCPVPMDESAHFPLMVELYLTRLQIVTSRRDAPNG